MKNLIKDILVEIGENPERDGLLKTPERVERAIRYLVKGYSEDENEIINGAIFDSPNNNMVIVKDIEFYSLCEHHMLPFFGKIKIAYLPNKKVIGLSKMSRIVEMYSRRLQIQENLAYDIAKCVKRAINPRGIAISIEAFHLCIAMRGARTQNSKTIATFYDGEFEKNDNLVEQFIKY